MDRAVQLARRCRQVMVCTDTDDELIEQLTDLLREELHDYRREIASEILHQGE
jgi:nitrogen regulatory protein PII-like uncharacterized protein